MSAPDRVVLDRAPATRIAVGIGAAGQGRQMFCAVYSSLGHSGFGVSYICGTLADALARADIDTEMHVPWAKAVPREARVRPAMPALAGRVLTATATRRQERAFHAALTQARDPRRFAYLWPDAGIDLVRALHAARVPMVREMINCHVATARRILDAAHAARGLGPGPIREAHVAYEREVLALVDRVVAPGPGVVGSLLENGVPAEKIVHASYGWDPARVRRTVAGGGTGRKLTFLFVGTLCVRKGVDTLVRAWRRAGIEGRLVLLGAVEPTLARFVAAQTGEDVVHLPFARSVAAQFAAADVFVMPALEEGGPLVTYEALGAGLPVIATPMGAGYAVVEGHNGLVVAPDDEAALAAAMRALADDVALRRGFAAASEERAAAFTWEQVGARTAAALTASLFG